MEHRHLAACVALFLLVSCLLRVDASCYTHYRLPASIQPEHYNLKIITHLENREKFSFDGQVSIRFQALVDTNNITLHAKNLTIDESRIQLMSYDDEQFRLCREGIETVPQHDYYIVRLCQTLLKGHMYNITFDFSGILNEKLDGYYRRSYVDVATNQTKWLSVTQFEPASARSSFPCFDEPHLKANFTIRLGHHKSLTALSNMPLERQIPMDELDDFVWSIFEESIPMSTYLAAYSLNDLIHKESKVGESDVVFRTWCRRDYIDQCDYAAEVAPKILQYYEQLLGIPFPFRKIDQIAIPNMSGGSLESWGLITYPENVLLFDPLVSPSSKKMSITYVIAHELAHQWFGNLVTMKWWTDLWLNEGFATYIGTLGTDNTSPEWDTYSIDSLLNSLQIFSMDVHVNSHPLSQAILNTSQIMKNFDVISYLKGSAVLRMTHLLLGQNGFFEGVNGYLAKHQYQNAEQDDVWATFTEKAHKFNRIQPQHDMKSILDSWTLQTGYPLVNVSRNYETGSMEISQHKFVENSITSNKDAKGCWWVPLSYTTASVLDFNTTTPKAWLECDGSGESVALQLDTAADPNEWIIFNIQLSAVYRVMYDTSNWRLLERTLNSDRFTDIHVMNRAHIIFDVISFVRNGYLDYGIAFDIFEYLTREREYLPWQSVAQDIDNMFSLLQHFPQYQALFKAYIRYIIEPIYNHLDGLTDPSETSMTHAQISLKKLVTNWACLADLELCVQAATDYFQRWKLTKNPDKVNRIPVDFRDTVYCTAIRHGDEDDWTFLWQRYKVSQVDQSDIIKSLSCSPRTAVLKDYLDLIFTKDEHMRGGDVSNAVDAIASNHIGLPIALEYYVEHISRLDDDGFDVAHLAVLLSQHIVLPESLHKLKESLNEHFKESKTSVSIARTSMQLSRQWIEHRLKDVNSQLQNRLS